MRAPTVSHYMVRQFMQGTLDMGTLPSIMKGQIETIARRMRRQALRAHKRDAKAYEYRAVALSGGGDRECARRLRQIAKGSLQVSA